METTQVYILIAITGVLVVALVLIALARRGTSGRLTPLAGVAFACIVASVFFGENRLVSYSLIAVGVILAIIDAVQRSRSA
jgi:hypothetical protein